jgi:replicative DNA helicase
MRKSEIVMRLLSAEARVKHADSRAGRMSDGDWTRMALRLSEITEAPLYIDDSPNLTMMEIRAKARRLKKKTDLRLGSSPGTWCRTCVILQVDGSGG